jgi:Type I phosphodiesterase / nucleotide pyrophosphatase
MSFGSIGLAQKSSLLLYLFNHLHLMNRKNSVSSAVVCGFGLLATSALFAAPPAPHSIADHVLLISVDGLHQSDLAWYVQTHPNSALACLSASGVNYNNASTPFPSDSFPGMTALATGGNPSTTGVYYDDTWNRELTAYGSTTPGVEVTYFEQLDKNPHALDAGQGIVPSGLTDPWAHILSLTGNPNDLIDVTQLPYKNGVAVYPNQYVKVNTIFEVAHNHGLRTAWSDKHPAYQILSGPSGAGVDEYFTPEINSSSDPANPLSDSAPDFTTDNLLTQKYDGYKVAAVLNWINGHHNDGSGNPGTPAILGMNFQSVSTGQKLPKSTTEGDLSGNATGGYMADGVTPGPVLSNALTFVDQSLGQMLTAITNRSLASRTAVIITAKHGQSPMNLAALNRIKDSTIMGDLNDAWRVHLGNPNAADLVALGVNDDGMLLWLTDRSPSALSFTHDFLQNYTTAAASVDNKPVTSAGLTQIYVGDAAAKLMGVPFNDARVPDVIGIAQYGVVYTGKKKKISEHGGNHLEDRNVPILVSFPGAAGGTAVTKPVQTTQVAPTIIKLLGLNPAELQAVRVEQTPSLF